MRKRNLVLEMLARWPSSEVARRSVYEFSGGAVCSGTLANADSRGEGPKGRYRLGKNVVYPARALAEWIAERSEAS